MFVIILNVLSPVVLFLREVNLDQNIVLTGADELKIFKSLRVYLCLVESVYCLERWNALLWKSSDPPRPAERAIKYWGERKNVNISGMTRWETKSICFNDIIFNFCIFFVSYCINNYLKIHSHSLQSLCQSYSAQKFCSFNWPDISTFENLCILRSLAITTTH